MLKLQKITKNYYVADQTIEALKGLTVDFRKSEFVAVLGPSGCGKTTLMNIIGGLDQYTSGDLMINDKSTKDFSDYDWDNYRNKKIGFVFQTYNLIPHQSVIQNVELALTLSGITKEERRQRATEALEKVGLGDQLRKRPNQLSGGQMQRVAIARALVNSPDILLADEPTGALDTQTSEQIMEIIKEISHDRLVIMVTHNPDLARRFSTRTIKMVDGLITEDSHPYDSDTDEHYHEEIASAKVSDTKKSRRKQKNKTAMSFFTALSLSLKNLNTKKARTILTSFAGSIGIIGIAMILAITSGINAYIDSLTVDTMATNPVIISPAGFDVDQAMNMQMVEETMTKFPTVEKVFVQEVMKFEDIYKKNVIDQEYVQYVKDNIKPEWVNDISYKTSHDMNIFGIKKGETAYSSVDGFVELGSTEFTAMQYQAIHGELPKNKNEIVIIVDEYNRITEDVLIELGYKVLDDEVTQYDFSEMIDKEFKAVPNNLMYEKKTGNKDNQDFDYFTEIINKDFDACIPLTVVGIARLRPELESGILSSGIGYTRELSEWILKENMSSDLVEWMNDNPLHNPMSPLGTKFASNPYLTDQEQWDSAIRKFGGATLPNDINIFPVDFEAKEKILSTLDNWNIENPQHVVTYTDFAAILSKVITEMVNYISFALIAFTAISLLVSSVMIGIITYVSVLERTKEIGILRAIGARKKDITRVFNAETFIIGLLAGFIGVIFTYLASIPINIIVNNVAGVKQLASLPIYQALILILVSVGLTVVSGLIPAFKAAKKDPVLALRTE